MQRPSTSIPAEILKNDIQLSHIQFLFFHLCWKFAVINVLHGTDNFCFHNQSECSLTVHLEPGSQGYVLSPSTFLARVALLGEIDLPPV